MMGLLIIKCIIILALLTRSKCRGSDIQVTIKACGPLVKRHFEKNNSLFKNHEVHKSNVTPHYMYHTEMRGKVVPYS